MEMSVHTVFASDIANYKDNGIVFVRNVDGMELTQQYGDDGPETGALVEAVVAKSNDVDPGKKTDIELTLWTVPGNMFLMVIDHEVRVRIAVYDLGTWK